MNKKYILKLGLDDKGVNLSGKKLDKLVREYNNHQMPIGERTSKIINEPEEFLKFLAYVKHYKEITEIKERVSFKNMIKNLFK